MITYNFMTGIRALFDGGSPYRLTSGNYQSKSAYEATNYWKYKADGGKDYIFSDQANRLLLGTGDTPESPEDYKLAELITDYTVLSSTKTLSGEYGKEAVIYSRVIQAGESGLTIKEQGLVLGLSGFSILIARDVLPEPVVLQPGEKHTFTMTIGLE